MENGTAKNWILQEIISIYFLVQDFEISPRVIKFKKLHVKQQLISYCFTKANQLIQLLRVWYQKYYVFLRMIRKCQE